MVGAQSDLSKEERHGNQNVQNVCMGEEVEVEQSERRKTEGMFGERLKF